MLLLRIAKAATVAQIFFDGTITPYGFEPFTLIGLIPLSLWAHSHFVRKRPAKMLFLISFVALVIVNGILNWDVYRVRQMAKSGEGLHITRGQITRHWSLTDRVRDHSRSGIVYKTVISEGFDVGTDRFQWRRGESYSAATFSNQQTPPMELNDGLLIEVIWFVDDSDNNARKIVKIAKFKN